MDYMDLMDVMDKNIKSRITLSLFHLFTVSLFHLFTILLFEHPYPIDDIFPEKLIDVS